jgi:hypothetical protein
MFVGRRPAPLEEEKWSGVTRDTALALDGSNNGRRHNPKRAPEKNRVDQQEVDPNVALARAKYSSEHEVLVERVGDPRDCQHQDSSPARCTPPQSEGDSNEERDWDGLNHVRILDRGGPVSKRYGVGCRRTPVQRGVSAMVNKTT